MGERDSLAERGIVSCRKAPMSATRTHTHAARMRGTHSRHARDLCSPWQRTSFLAQAL